MSASGASPHSPSIPGSTGSIFVSPAIPFGTSSFIQAQGQQANQSRTVRRANPAYKGRNGFIDPAPSSLSEEGKITKFMEDYRFAQFVMEERGMEVSPEDMEKELREMEREEQRIRAPGDPDLSGPIERLTTRLKDLQATQLRELNKLYDLNAKDYLEEQRDKFLSRDESQYVEPGETNPTLIESYKKLDDMYSWCDSYPPSHWSNDYDRLRYAHLQDRLPLEKQLHELKKRAEEITYRRERKFPMSIEEYNSIRNKVVRLRIARFLKLGLLPDGRDQEKMMNEFKWDPRQVVPLKAEFEKNPDFQKAVLEDDKQQAEAADPRKRR